MFKNGMRPIHPGEVLREDFLKPLGMSANALAKALNVAAPRVNDIVRERRGVSADTAMRLARLNSVSLKLPALNALPGRSPRWQHKICSGLFG